MTISSQRESLEAACTLTPGGNAGHQSSNPSKTGQPDKRLQAGWPLPPIPSSFDSLGCWQQCTLCWEQKHSLPRFAAESYRWGSSMAALDISLLLLVIALKSPSVRHGSVWLSLMCNQFAPGHGYLWMRRVILATYRQSFSPCLVQLPISLSARMTSHYLGCLPSPGPLVLSLPLGSFNFAASQPKEKWFFFLLMCRFPQGNLAKNDTSPASYSPHIPYLYMFGC